MKWPKLRYRLTPKIHNVTAFSFFVTGWPEELSLVEVIAAYSDPRQLFWSPSPLRKDQNIQIVKIGTYNEPRPYQRMGHIMNKQSLPFFTVQWRLKLDPTETKKCRFTRILLFQFSSFSHELGKAIFFIFPTKEHIIRDIINGDWFMVSGKYLRIYPN